MDQGIIQGRTC